MYSPGTIKAIGLMSKGVSADKAFAQASQIDLQSAQTRVNFYTEQSLNSPSLLSSFTTAGAPSTVVAPPTPTPTVAPPPKTVIPLQAKNTLAGQTAVLKDTLKQAQVTPAPTPQQKAAEAAASKKVFQDMIDQGYKRNIGDGSYFGEGVTPNGKVVPVLPSQKKLKTFYDDKFMPTAQEIETQKYILPEDKINFISPSLKNNGWGIKNQTEGLKSAVGETVKILDAPIPTPSSMSMLNLESFRTPEQQALRKQESDQKIKSLSNTANSFFTSNTIEDLDKNKKLIYKDIDTKLKDLNKQYDYWSTAATRAQDANISKDSAEVIAKIVGQTQELNKLKLGVADTYKERVSSIKGKEATARLKQLRGEYTNDEDYFKALEGYKNKAGGLAVVNTDLPTLFKDIYKDSYMNRALTQADIDKGGEQVINEMALNRFLQGTPLTGDEEDENRYDAFKGHLLESHGKLGDNMMTELTREVITDIKRQEQIIKESNNPNISKAKLDELTKEFTVLEKRVNFNNKLSGKVAEIHSRESFKTNKELSGFLDSYLTLEEKKQERAKVQFGDASWGKAGFMTGRTIQKVGQGIAQQFFGNIAETAGNVTGWDWLETKARRFNNMVTVEDLVNYDRMTASGRYQTSADFIVTDEDGSRSYNPSVLLYQGAEMVPLIAGSMYGGSALTNLGGRLVAKNLSTLTARGLMGARTANQFTGLLAKTGSYKTAFQAVTKASSNPLVRQLSARVPNAMAMSAIVYPQQFVNTYEDLYNKGVDNARLKAHAIAAITTGIEVLTENIYPDMKFLDDFAEKGVIGKSWVGTLQQYRTLYGDVFGKSFSPNTLDYLATRSLQLAGKGASVGRFMAVRGAQEGVEEVTSELMNYFADNNMGLAEMRGEPPTEFSVDNLVTAFAGSFFTFPFGAGNQVKSYNENRKYGQMYDIMLNATYYKNKVNEAVKAGSMNQDQAANVLGKIQELETIEQEYGVRNLRNAEKANLSDMVDLMQDQHVQFDYFKNILKNKSIEDKLLDLDKATYTDEQKAELVKMSEESTSKIEKYKKRSDFYSQLTNEDKQAVLETSINKKLQIGRRTKTENLEKLGTDLEDYTASAIANKRPQYFVDSIRNYRDNVQKIVIERAEAEDSAIQSGTYNPLVDHLENKTPSTSLASIQTVEDLEDAMVQALLSPDRGKDLEAYVYGLFDKQLENLESDTEKITIAYLDSIQKAGTERSDGETQEPLNTEVAIADLTEEQQEELSELLSELNNQYDDILDRKNVVSDMMTKVLNSVAPGEILDIEDEAAREAAQISWVQGLYNRVNDSQMALGKVIENDTAFPQNVFYDKVRFAEYRADNRTALDKEVEVRRKAREAQNPPPAEVTERGTVTTTETSTETGKEVKVTSPGLAPEDITPEFAAGIEQLETMSLSDTVSEVSAVTGEVTAEQQYNTERGEVISQLLGEVVASTTIESAQAKMRVIMETAGSTPEEINDTLKLMERIANDEPVFEEDYTYMFNLLLIKANIDLNKLKFEFTTPEAVVVAPPIPAPLVDNRPVEEIERTTVIPNVQLRSLEGKLVEYNGVRGVLTISEGGVVTVETDSAIYELENANPNSSTLEHMIQEVTTELDSKDNDDIMSETEVILDGVEYLIETDSKGNVVGLRDKKKPQKRITKNKLLIRAEVLRNRLEHQVITEAIEETPELIEAIAEAVQALPSAQVVENLFNFNMTDTIASAIDKLYESGNNKDLSEAELLETELWIMDTWYKLDDLAKEYPTDEVYQNALENLLIINKLLYNGKQTKSGRKITAKKPAQEKETRVAPRKAETQSTSKSAVTKESAKPKQLNLFADQPRLSPEQIAERDTQERASAAQYAQLREEAYQEAIAEDELYTEYLAEKEAFNSLALTPEGQALEGNRISRDSFVRFADKANLQGREGKAIIFAYIGKRGEGVEVDEIARIASGMSDTEVTAQDIIDFILTYPGGIGGPTSKSDTTYFGRSNPDINPRYSNIRELIKSRSKEARSKANRKKKLTSPTTTSSGDFNVAETKDNTANTTELDKREPKTDSEVAQVETQNQIVNTTKLYRPSETARNSEHFAIQERIIQSVDKEFRSANTAVVDLFTIVEQVLGVETLVKMEEIFDEVKSNPTPERLQELRTQFLSLFPANFMDISKVEHMFDTQIVKNVSQSDLTQTNVRNLNATESEIYQVNKGRAVKEAKLKDGRVIQDTIVRESNGKLFLLKAVPVLDAKGTEIKDAQGKPMVEKTWIRFDQLANPTEILMYPIMGTEPMTFNALNVLAFTVLDSEGKVQKFNNNGDKTESGNKVLINYLPTSKGKPNPTPQQQAFDTIRNSVAQGERIVHNVQIVGPSRSDEVTMPDKSVKNSSYAFTFSTETLTPVDKTLTPVEVIEENQTTETTTSKGNQQDSIDALEKLVAKAKTIPDPSKEGYLIDGERYERQSGFTKRVLGKVQVDTEESTENMEKGAAVGNFLDIIGRDVLGGRPLKSRKEYIQEAEEIALNSKLNKGKGYKLEFTQEQFDSLIKELEDFRKELNRKGYKLFTEGLVVYRKYTAEEKAATGYVGLAGAMDIVAIDAEGGVHIIDFKNKKFKNPDTFKSSMYNSNERFPSNVSKWSSQQTTYGILSKDFGLPIRSINILVFASQYEESEGKITINMLSKGSDKVPILAENKSDISDAVIKLKGDNKIAKQIELRTANPNATTPKEPTTKDLNNIKENIPEFTDSEAKNLSLILSLYNLPMSNTKGLDPSDETPDTKNPPACNPVI